VAAAMATAAVVAAAVVAAGVTLAVMVMIALDTGIVCQVTSQEIRNGQIGIAGYTAVQHNACLC